jgi:hypothetical protein
MYKVIEYFTDLQDGGFAYKVGDVFPRKGKDVTDERINELASDKNRRRKPLIEKVESTEEVPTPPADDFMNPPIMDDTEDNKDVVAEKPKKKRGRPRND